MKKLIPNGKETIAYEGRIFEIVKQPFRVGGKKIVFETEYLLLCKSLKSKFQKIKNRIKETHRYETPAIVSINISEGEENYLDWVKLSVR